MLPEDYLEEIEEEAQGKERHLLLGITALMLFTVSLLYLGPLLHEVSHAVVLESIGCEYSFKTMSSYEGVYGEVQPLCTMEDIQLIIFYLIGYVNVFLAGAVPGIWIHFSETDHWKEILYGSAGTGFLGSLLLSISRTGDIPNTLRILGLSTDYSILVSIVFFIMTAVVGFKLLEMFLATRTAEEMQQEGRSRSPQNTSE